VQYALSHYQDTVYTMTRHITQTDPFLLSTIPTTPHTSHCNNYQPRFYCTVLFYYSLYFYCITARFVVFDYRTCLGRGYCIIFSNSAVHLQVCRNKVELSCCCSNIHITTYVECTSRFRRLVACSLFSVVYIDLQCYCHCSCPSVLFMGLAMGSPLLWASHLLH